MEMHRTLARLGLCVAIFDVIVLVVATQIDEKLMA